MNCWGLNSVHYNIVNINYYNVTAAISSLKIRELEHRHLTCFCYFSTAEKLLFGVLLFAVTDMVIVSKHSTSLAVLQLPFVVHKYFVLKLPSRRATVLKILE